MKTKHSYRVVPTAIASMLMLAATIAVAGTDAGTPQPDFPRIVRQPEDQMARFGERAVFNVQADNGPLTYQWLRDGKPLPGQTSSTLTIEKAQSGDLGHYSCNVMKDVEVVPTRAASLALYTSHIDPETGIDPVYAAVMPSASSGSNSVCGIAYVGVATYTKTVAQGWGWKPSTNTTVHTATDTNRNNTWVLYSGRNGDSGCAKTTVTLPQTPPSSAYRFSVYFTNNVPTNAYTIVLDGFDP